METTFISFPLLSGIIAGLGMGLIVVVILYLFERISVFSFSLMFLAILFLGIIPHKYLESYWQVPDGSICLSYIAVLFVYFITDIVKTVKLLYRRRKAKQKLQEKIANAKIIYVDDDYDEYDCSCCGRHGIEEEL